MSGPVLTTIAAKNYLAHVRVLCKSFLAHHPGGRCIVLLSDRSDGYVNAADEPFELIEAEALGVPEFESLAFKYDILELSTALKPYFLSRLFDDPNVDRLVYFDPDILVTRDLNPLFSMLDDHEVLLTPHLTRRFDDAKRPNELDILRAGTHNLGFIALRQSSGARELLDWWKEQCFDGCWARPEEGYFVDQRWLDLAPTMFSGVHVVSHPGWNVAYWNLHERNVIWGDDPRSNGEPLYFFHFSGFDVRDPHAISKHQDRFRLEERPDLVELFLEYRKRLLDEGYDECARWPLAFDYFEGGTPIDSLTRELYRSLEPHRRSAFGNPFETSGARSFLRWCTSRADLSAVESRRRRRRRRRWRALRRWVVEAMSGGIPIVNNRMYQAYLDDPDFRDISPDLAGAAHPSFLDLYRRKEDSGSGDRKLEAPLDPLQEQLGSEHLLRPKGSRELGVNIAGYLTTESGVAEGARRLVEALDAARIPRSLVDIDSDRRLPRGDYTFTDFSRDNPFAVNIVVVNADQTTNFANLAGKRFFRKHYNIGYWTWELAEFPGRSSEAFRHFDEIWAPSRFCVEAISEVSPVPVVCMPYPVSPKDEKLFDGSYFGLAPRQYSFLFSFDFMSHFERKNPLGVIRAFREAFGEKSNTGVQLIIKSSCGEHFPHQRAQMRAEAEGLNVTFIDRTLGRDEFWNLLRLCDCYVSLHRSEGFGLTLAEAMCLGKPVIATEYSGNLDFMDRYNSLLVRSRPIRIDREAGLYEIGQEWAEPDLAHAAKLMLDVFENQDAAKLLGERARSDTEVRLGVQVIGRRIKGRLESISSR